MYINFFRIIGVNLEFIYVIKLLFLGLLYKFLDFEMICLGIIKYIISYIKDGVYYI